MSDETGYESPDSSKIYKNNSTAGYARGSLTVHNLFFCSQNNFDRKSCCDVSICLQHQNDRNVIIKCLHHQVQKSKQKYVTERYGGLY